jgi:hypothetical protein
MNEPKTLIKPNRNDAKASFLINLVPDDKMLTDIVKR